MSTARHFSQAGHRDGPVQPTAPPPRHPRNGASGPGSDRKPGSARPHEGSGGTRNMAQSSVTDAAVPLHHSGHLPGTAPASPSGGDRIRP